MEEIKILCSTLRKWKLQICGYFKTEEVSNGPAEAVNGIIETIRRFAREFQNFENDRLRSPMADGGHRTYRT